jgi:hypothetical protein
MATIQLPPDFKEFLRLLNANRVEYLLIRGYAVAYHGYPRATGDLGIWIAPSAANAKQLARALKQFGFALPESSAVRLQEEGRILRLGMPPLRIEIATAISGVAFAERFAERKVEDVEGIPVSINSSRHLNANKRAAGKPKDLADLDNLP